MPHRIANSMASFRDSSHHFHFPSSCNCTAGRLMSSAELSSRPKLRTTRSNPSLVPVLGDLKGQLVSQSESALNVPSKTQAPKSPMLSHEARKQIMSRITNVPAKDLILLELPFLYSANVTGATLYIFLFFFALCILLAILSGDVDLGILPRIDPEPSSLLLLFLPLKYFRAFFLFTAVIFNDFNPFVSCWPKSEGVAHD